MATQISLQHEQLKYQTKMNKRNCVCTRRLIIILTRNNYGFMETRVKIEADYK